MVCSCWAHAAVPPALEARAARPGSRPRPSRGIWRAPHLAGGGSAPSAPPRAQGGRQRPGPIPGAGSRGCGPVFGCRTKSHPDPEDPILHASLCLPASAPADLVSPPVRRPQSQRVEHSLPCSYRGSLLPWEALALAASPAAYIPPAPTSSPAGSGSPRRGGPPAAPSPAPSGQSQEARPPSPDTHPSFLWVPEPPASLSHPWHWLSWLCWSESHTSPQPSHPGDDGGPTHFPAHSQPGPHACCPSHSTPGPRAVYCPV